MLASLYCLYYNTDIANIEDYAMPTIVKHVDKKSGTTRVYESTSHYDPVTKQSRPKRKYLGTLDPETGELIPSSGRKGRTPSRKNVPTSDEASELAKQVEKLQKAGARKDEEILSLKNEVCRLKSVIRAYGKVCEAISADLGKAPDCHD